MDKETIRQELLKIRTHFEKLGLFKPIRKEPIIINRNPGSLVPEICEEPSPEIIAEKLDTLETIEQMSFSNDEIKVDDLNF